MNRPFTSNPYPNWYRKSPLAILMPWRNLGCLGFKCFGLYIDLYRIWRFPYIGIFMAFRGHKVWVLAEVRRYMRGRRIRKWWQSVRDHAASNLMELQWEQGTAELITRWQVMREYRRVIVEHLRYDLGALVCKRFGHSKHVEHHDFVSGERDEHGFLTDIDGGGVDWFCPRCGQGGRSWF